MQIRRRIAVDARRPLGVLLGWAIGAIVLDRITKWIVLASVKPNDSIPVIDNFFHITLVRNTGAAFGLMPGRQPLFVLTSCLVIVGIAVYAWRMRPMPVWLNVSLGLIAGGAFGNLIDRAGSGRVIDFFDFVIIEFPVFNIADSAIVVGTSMLVAWVLFGPDSDRARRRVGDEPGEEAPVDSSGGGGVQAAELP